VPFDTLDFTSFTLNLGSKMVLDATRNGKPVDPPPVMVEEAETKRLHPRIRASRCLEGCLLAVQVEGEGRSVVEELVKAPHLGSVKLIAAVSQDVDLHDRESLLCGIFTRFDPARDVVFTQAELKGSWPVYRGRLGIDATFKPGYPDPIEMDPAIIKLVDQRWHQYWHA
jgi:4-hydroxy-3-polyprenylbenzoate decarboxylase